MRAARRWFDVLLRLFPREFRERQGDAMRETFARAYAERRAAGRWTLAAFLVRTFLDLLLSGVRERLAPGRGGGPAGGLVSWLDVKLGLRMLAKHPGLTLVSVFALAVGIPVGLAPAHVVDGIMAHLPVREGERIRSLRLWSTAEGRATPTTFQDYEAWRAGLASFKGLAAFRETAHNVDVGVGVVQGEGGAVRGAEMTASAFDVLQVRPLLGRPLQPADEVPGGEQVVVLGHDLWRSRYAGDPDVVGRVIRLGATPHTVVGVMPRGFFFPERQSLWTPLRVPTEAGPGSTGPGSPVPVRIFGRLGEGVGDATARSELAVVARRSAPPDRDPRIQPQVGPFALVTLPGAHTGLRGTPEFIAFQGLALIVLLVACVNVGMLIFARTATRANELAVRTALGASRARIVTQVFVECLVLAVLASGAGLVLMQGAVAVTWRVIPDSWVAQLPWWISWDVELGTALRALALAGFSAVLAGVVPALRFTGRSVQSTIQRARARRTGTRFGGLSGVLIVVDVAVAVATVGFAVTAIDLVRRGSDAGESVGIPADEYLAATVRLPAGRGAGTQEELVRRLRAEPGVRGVAVADALPRMDHRTRRVQAEGVETTEARGMSIRMARVAVDYFEALDRPLLSGRPFDSGDLRAEPSPVIVNTAFVDRVLGGQNALGRRIRFLPWGDGEPGPWKEIVGVVGPLGMRVVSAESSQGVYEPFAPGDLEAIRLGIHVGGDPTSFAPRLRTIAGQVDPGAIVTVTGPLDEVYEGDWYFLLAASLGAGLLLGVLLAVAASGIYAIMSFSVAERSTEIGIRTALGAGRSDVVLSVVRRAVLQLSAGVLLGMPVAASFLVDGTEPRHVGVAWTLGVGAAVMVLVGLVACTGPTLRALRVQPDRALRGDG